MIDNACPSFRADDDIPPKDCEWLKRVANIFDKHPGAGVLGIRNFVTWLVPVDICSSCHNKLPTWSDTNMETPPNRLHCNRFIA